MRSRTLVAYSTAVLRRLPRTLGRTTTRVRGGQPEATVTLGVQGISDKTTGTVPIAGSLTCRTPAVGQALTRLVAAHALTCVSL